MILAFWASLILFLIVLFWVYMEYRSLQRENEFLREEILKEFQRNEKYPIR